MPPGAPHSFHWTQCSTFLGPELLGLDWSVDPGRTRFSSADCYLYVPLVVPIPLACRSLEAYLESLPEQLGRHCLILMQAGAASIGLFEGAQALHTKSMKKYVVRGRGRAQPTHLKTKGKSRYGSRLRLQNARLLLEETAERLCDWWRDEGPAEEVYVSAPERLWADFLRLEPLPWLAKKDSTLRIPLDLPRPTTDVLLRTYRAMEYGRILPRG